MPISCTSQHTAFRTFPERHGSANDSFPVDAGGQLGTFKWGYWVLSCASNDGTAKRLRSAKTRSKFSAHLGYERGQLARSILESYPFFAARKSATIGLVVLR